MHMYQHSAHAHVSPHEFWRRRKQWKIVARGTTWETEEVAALIQVCQDNLIQGQLNPENFQNSMQINILMCD